MRKRRRLRFRWGYLKAYGWRRSFAFGELFGPLLVYRPRHVVYVKKYIDRDAVLDVKGDLMSATFNDAMGELFRSVPYDFGFAATTSFQDYDIDYNRYIILVEGIPQLKKVP